ncbi:A disintegrin and metalloproteinase with thrombospondin motifs 7-like [Mytilus galloprovincialis]|uniref:A disintegrin and metalloproteinase with thrombospondin motifs 7-like n=1 Tax=Mytilus galloprovincialis TaxID=29158 RepID=UPI003F7B7788
MLYDPDTQCRHIYGNSSELSRWSYKGDFTSICGELNCKNPKDPTSYIQTEAAEERTQCGNKKWCVDGACTFDSKAPSGIDNCLFGDEKSNVFSNGWSCAKMVQVAPNNCPAVPIKCCASCAPPTTTTPSSTSKSPTTITTPTTTRIPTTTTFSTTITTPSTSKIPTTT